MATTITVTTVPTIPAPALPRHPIASPPRASSPGTDDQALHLVPGQFRAQGARRGFVAYGAGAQAVEHPPFPARDRPW